MFRWLLPKDISFFDYFEQHVAMSMDACREFLKLAAGEGDQIQIATRIKEIEHQGDDLAHRCIANLNNTFITPIDRVDIYQLMTRLDDVLDAVDATTSRLTLYELKEIRPEAQQLAQVLLKAVSQIQSAVNNLRRMNKPQAIIQNLIAVHEYENEGDTILRVALARLFQEETHQPILVVKWKEIFERLERATDRCEEVANIIEKIVIEAS